MAQTDKKMSARLENIFNDPTKHKFYSCFEAFKQEDRRGPRGSVIKGKKSICIHCGQKQPGHATQTVKLN